MAATVACLGEGGDKTAGGGNEAVRPRTRPPASTSSSMRLAALRANAAFVMAMKRKGKSRSQRTGNIAPTQSIRSPDAQHYETLRLQY